jgi:hypothetical protein
MKTGFRFVVQLLGILSHQGGDKILLLTRVVARVAPGVTHHHTGVLDVSDVIGRQQV